ncbi:MAG TPA: ABC transporter substrate-binding protein [Acidimicrobiales bacterium]|nr:ABC transporter substrate-binding protein [Acidimicrobiales bacterium]
MRRQQAVALGLGLALVLAACGSTDEDKASESDETETDVAASSGDPADSACKDKTLTFIGLAGEEGDAELQSWRDERGAELESSWPGDWPQLISALKVGQVFDLSTIPYHQAQRMIAADVLQPLDTDRLENWDKIAPGLREHSSLRGPDGKIYGAPIAWGDGPFVYAPDRVDEPPASILDLLKPEWKGRFVMFDTPDQPFHQIAIADGFTDSPLLTPEQLEQVKGQASDLVANAAAFNSGYQDAADRLVAGDVDVAIGGWEAMLTWAAEDGVELEFGFFDEGKGGWWDGLAIPTTADDVDCAYEYIDTILSADVNAELATNLVSGAVNEDAVDKVGEDAQIYDYSVVEEPDDANFKSTTPPEDPPAGIASYQDWIDAWAEIKAG